MERLVASRVLTQQEVDNTFTALLEDGLLYAENMAGYPDESITTPGDVVALPEDQELTGEESAAEQELLTVAKAERDSNPTTEWPESDAAGHTTETEYNQRLNYRLSIVGFMLDAARPHIESAGAAQKWLELKRVVMETKAVTDVYSKVDVVIALEAVAYDFAIAQGATQADYDKAVSG